MLRALSNAGSVVLTKGEEACSAWVLRFLPLVRPGGRVLDLAAGGGRHTKLLLDRDYRVRAVDRNIAALSPLAGPRCTVEALDLETGDPWSLGTDYDGIVVTNYLHRALLPAIAGALALRPGELLEAFDNLTVVGFEQGDVTVPRSATIQRIAAVNGPLGRLA